MSSSKQSSITSIKDLNGNQSWDALLKDLYSASLGIPEDWSQETSAQWSSDQQSLIVTVPSSAADDWINRRLLPIANILFQEKHDKKRLVIQKKGEGEKNELLVKVHKDAYEHVVRPRKMIPVPFYLLHHWLPVLGASPFWVVIAIIQQSFVNIAKEKSVQKRISTRELSYWAPLSHNQISDHLKKGGFSSWFYVKEKEGYQDVPPEYKVWSDLPVAPHHLAWIDNYCRDFNKGGTAVSLLEDLLDKTGDIRRVKFGDIDIPDSFASQRISVLDIVGEHYPGKQDQLVYNLATELERQVVWPNWFFSIPHYFFEKYGGSLRPNEAALIWYLRSKSKDDDTDSHKFSGYSQLSTAIGCSHMTARRILASCASPDGEPLVSSWNYSFVDREAINNWLSVRHISHNKNGSADKYSIRVRATEPIHQDDDELYVQMVEDLLSIAQEKEEESPPSQNITPDEGTHPIVPSQNITPNSGSGYSIPSQNITPDEKTGSNIASQNITPPAQNITPPTQNITPPNHTITPDLHNSLHLKSSIKESLNTSLNESLIPPLPSTADQAAQNVSKVVGVGEINLDKLLGFGSYKHNEKKKLVELISENQEIFLAWIIRNHITAAKFPVRLAVKNVQEGNETENQYLELARLGWGIVVELVRASENISDDGRGNLRLSFYDDDDHLEYGYLIEFFRNLSNTAKKEIKKLRETNFAEMVDNVLGDGKQ